MNISLPGKLFVTNYPLNFKVTNTIIDFTDMIQAVSISGDCSLTENPSTNISIIFSNITLTGSKQNLLTNPLINIKSMSNLFLDRVQIQNFPAMVNDVSFINITPMLTCNQFINTSIKKTFQFTNSVMTFNQYTDKNLNMEIFLDLTTNQNLLINQEILIENFTLSNLPTSSSNIVVLTSDSTNMIQFRNIIATNITKILPAASLFDLSSVGDIYINNFTISSSILQLSTILQLATPGSCYFNYLSIQNITLSTTSTTDSLINFESLKESSIISMNNLLLQNNQLFQNQFFSIDNPATFTMENATFINERISSSTSYMVFFAIYSINIVNVTFYSMNYNDFTQKQSYIIMISSQVINSKWSKNSLFKNVMISNSSLNLFTIKSFEDVQEIKSSSLFLFQNISIINNILQNLQNYISFDSFSTNCNVSISFQDCKFSNNSFMNGGRILFFEQNMVMPIKIINTEISQNYKGWMELSPGQQGSLYSTLKLQMSNCTFIKNRVIINPLIVLNENSQITVNDSYFQENFSNTRGSIILLKYQLAKAYFFNSNFISNYAFEGGIFFAEEYGYVNLQNCTGQSNFAIIGGIGVLQSNSYIDIDNCTFTENSAYQKNFIYITTSYDSISHISGSTIQRNINQNASNLSSSFLKQFDESYSNFLIKQQQQSIQMQDNGSLYAILAIQTNIIMTNLTLKNQKNFLRYFNGILFIDTISIQNVTYSSDDRDFFYITSSTASISNIQIRNMASSLFPSSAPSKYLFSVNLNSLVTLTNITIQSYESPFIYVTNSQTSLQNVLVQQVNSRSTKYIFITLNQASFSISNISLVSITLGGTRFMDISRSDVSLNQLSCIQVSTWYIIRSEHSELNISNSYFEGVYSALGIRKAFRLRWSPTIIVNSTFKSFSWLRNGGAIQVNNGDFSVYNSSFINNSAKYGGAISFDSASTSIYSYIISGTFFDSNNASVSGGGIFYNTIRPTYTYPNIFGLNKAPYGPNIAGPPFSIRLISYDNYILESGGRYNGVIQIAVVDADDQIIASSTDIYQVKIESVLSNASAYGTSAESTDYGVATFDKVIFKAPPGSVDIPFKLFSPHINTEDLKRFYNLSDSFVINEVYISFSFRNCSQGEILSHSMYNLKQPKFYRCIPCSIGTYSFETGGILCSDCLENAECLGGNVISLNTGYWRSSLTSTNIIQCLSESACVGGTGISNSTFNTSLYPYCSNGYGGNLCGVCIETEGVQYTSIGNFECGICPDKMSNIIKLIGVLIAVIMAIALLIYTNIRKTKTENETAVIMRILTNYIQIMTTAAAMSLRWPTSLGKFFGVVNSVGEAEKSFISIDCFLKTSPFMNSSLYYLKTILAGLFPLLCIFFFMLLFSGLYLLTPRLILSQFKNYFIVTIVVIIYTCLPTIVRYCFGLFQCLELDSGEWWLIQDLNTQCWSQDHLKFSFTLGFILIITYMICCPLWAFLILKKNKDNLRDNLMSRRLQMIFIGLKEEFYYWEFINYIRKSFLIMVNVFLQVFPDYFKALLSLLVLAIFLRIQEKIEPYHNPLFNSLESREYMTTIVTFYGALFFLTDEIQENVKIIAMVVIIIFNLIFVLFWLYCMVRQFREKYPMVKKVTSLFEKVSIPKNLVLRMTTYEANKVIKQEKGNLVQEIKSELQINTERNSQSSIQRNDGEDNSGRSSSISQYQNAPDLLNMHNRLRNKKNSVPIKSKKTTLATKTKLQSTNNLEHSKFYPKDRQTKGKIMNESLSESYNNNNISFDHEMSTRRFLFNGQNQQHEEIKEEASNLQKSIVVKSRIADEIGQVNLNKEESLDSTKEDKKFKNVYESQDEQMKVFKSIINKEGLKKERNVDNNLKEDQGGDTYKLQAYLIRKKNKKRKKQIPTN